MRSARRVVRTATLLACAAPLAAQRPLVPEQTRAAVVREGREGSQVMAHLDWLVNRIGPRLTSSDNLTEACAWARDRFRSFGIANARLEEWGSFPVGFNRGPARGAITEPASLARDLVFTTPAWSAGTRGRVEGPVLRAPRSLAAAKKLGDSLRGAWLLAGSGMRRGRGSRTLSRYFVEQGVAGMLRPAFTLGSGKYKDLCITDGKWRIRFDRLPKLPSVQLQRSDYDAIRKALRKAKDGGRIHVAFDIRNWFKQGPIPLYNVIADIRGSEHPDEYVVVGGHIDSWDGATGTTDNGTGTATTLEAARLLMAAGAKPERTIRFMLWSGEEQGLLGSRAYVNKHRASGLMDKISAVFVHDMGTNYVSGLIAMPSVHEPMQRALAGLSGVDKAFPFRLRKGNFVVPGSDHYPFYRARVPAFFWAQSGSADYNWTHHTQHDRYEAAVARYQRHSATVIALAALGTANLPALLPRVKPVGFNPFGGAPSRGRRYVLGVILGDDGLTVGQVTDGSIAEASGVEPGDKLLFLAGKKLAGESGEVREALRSWVGGGRKKTLVVVERDGKRVELRLVDPAAGNAKNAKKD